MSNLIIKPRVSEKALALPENSNTYVFDVPINSTKIDIKNNIEKHFKVKVKNIRIVNLKGKIKRFKKIQGYENNVKKAYINLVKGNSIKIFESSK